MTRATPYEWGVSSLNYRDEAESGDQWVLTEFEGGVQVAMIDALGHGSQAAAVAGVASRTLKQHAGEALPALFERCHADLRVTRGAAMSVARFDWRQKVMTWLGVGNVAGIVVAGSGSERHAMPLLVHSGVVGDRLPELQSSVFPLARDMTLIMASDGVGRDFMDAAPGTTEPQQSAQRLLEDYARHNDDATVLVFCCKGDL